MIDWLDESCKSWGRCTRWILADTNEGFPAVDTIEKARQGMLSFGTLGARHWPEVRVAAALEIARAMAIVPHMPLVLTAHLYAQYVVEGRARQKLPALSRYLGQVITVAEYWRNIDRAHYFLAARVPLSPREVVATAISHSVSGT